MELEGRSLVCLRDPEGFAEQPVFLPAAAALLISRMDGGSTLGDIQAEFLRRTGELLPMGQLADFVTELDRLHFLDSPAFDAFRAGVVRAFREADLRPAAHAGAAYAGSPDALRGQIDAFFAPPEGPGLEPGPAPARALRGLIAPHIDFHRGGPAYAHAYAALARAEPFDRYVIFGTCHAGMERRFALTEKDYDTPLGRAETDREFVRRVAGRLAVDYFHDEPAHRNEHSIEFQAVCLRHLAAPRRSFTIVPILVGSFHDVFDGRDLGEPAPEIEAMVAAVREALAGSAGRSCVIAGADLAHVGRRFGDRSGPTRASLEEVARRDRELLEAAARGAAAGVLGSIASDGDLRRVCGYPPIYMALRALEPAAGEVLDYRQWCDLEGGAAVTFASVALY
jgi:AmmeMemoRadiSam system protein B